MYKLQSANQSVIVSIKNMKLTSSFITLVSITNLFGFINCVANNADVATVLFSDVKSHLNDYMSYVQNNPTFSFPTELINYFTAITTYTDDSYTTLLSDFPASQIATLASELPWYSSRLETKLESAFTADGLVSASGSQSTSSPAVSSGASTAASSILSSALSSFNSQTKSSSKLSESTTAGSSKSASSIGSTSPSSSINSSNSKAFGVVDYSAPTFLVLLGGIFSSVFIL